MAEIQHIQGLSALHKALQDFPEELEKKILRGALRAGANAMKKAAQGQVPVKSGALRKSIKVKTVAKKNRYRLHARVVAGDKDAYYAHMVEFGTAAHLIKPKNKLALFFAGVARSQVEHPGTRPRPFMRPAFDAANEAAVQAFAGYVRNALGKQGVQA